MSPQAKPLKPDYVLSDSHQVIHNLEQSLTIKAPDPNIVLNLQRTLGNIATINLLQRWNTKPQGTLVQRSDAPLAIPALDPIQDILEDFRNGELIEKNTAEMVDNGRVTHYYIDECPPYTESELEPESPYKEVLHPITGKVIKIQKIAKGFAEGTDIFTNRLEDPELIKTIFIHEVNHVLYHGKESKDDGASFDRYRDEFQAYWISKHSEIEDLDKRAERIKMYILIGYPALGKQYATNKKFKRQVDNHKRPDGNLINSPRWEAVIKATEGDDVDKEALFQALQEMSSEERAFVRDDKNFMKLITDALKYDDILKAYLYLYDFSEHAVACIDEITSSADVEVICQHLSATTAEERQRLLSYDTFMKRLRKGLSKAEMAQVEAVLKGETDE